MSELLPRELYTCAQTRALDQLAIQSGLPGIVLMKRAGRAAFKEIMIRWPTVDQLLIFCGAGNNGGDGYVVAALAAQNNLPVKVFSIIEPTRLNGDAQAAYAYAVQEGVEIQSAQASVLAGLTGHALSENTVIVDAILGTGFQAELRPDVRGYAQLINQLNCPVIALDIPTGLEGDTGWADADAVKADMTITFIALKRGLFTGRAPALCGEIRFANLGIASEIYTKVPSELKRARYPHALPARHADAHKGQHGHVMVIGGDLGMGGAALMAAEAALIAGAGVVTLVTHPQHVAAALSRLPEVMTVGVDAGIQLQSLLKKVDVLVVGPGLGQAAWAEQLLYFALHSGGRPTVIDADALNLVAKASTRYADLSHCVMTPHPKEAARLLNCTLEDIQRDRFQAVAKLRQRFSATILLKGAGTLIGSGSDITLTQVGCAAMAVGGMGDILSGVIGALLAQGLSLNDAAVHAACVHGLAGELAANEIGERGVRATELLPLIRQQLNG